MRSIIRQKSLYVNRILFKSLLLNFPEQIMQSRMHMCPMDTDLRDKIAQIVAEDSLAPAKGVQRRKALRRLYIILDPVQEACRLPPRLTGKEQLEIRSGRRTPLCANEPCARCEVAADVRKSSSCSPGKK